MYSTLTRLADLTRHGIRRHGSLNFQPDIYLRQTRSRTRTIASIAALLRQFGKRWKFAQTLLKAIEISPQDSFALSVRRARVFFHP